LYLGITLKTENVSYVSQLLNKDASSSLLQQHEQVLNNNQ